MRSENFQKKHDFRKKSQNHDFCCFFLTSFFVNLYFHFCFSQRSQNQIIYFLNLWKEEIMLFPTHLETFPTHAGACHNVKSLLVVWDFAVAVAENAKFQRLGAKSQRFRTISNFSANVSGQLCQHVHGVAQKRCAESGGATDSPHFIFGAAQNFKRPITPTRKISNG